jgi:dipeptidyl aminopeptidase/acylaminoacyl peptidase
VRAGARAALGALALAGVLAAAGTGCKGGSGGSGGGGGGGEAASATAGAGQQALDASGAADLRLSPDGKHATYLVSPEKPRLKGLPPQVVLGELHAVGLEGGAPRKLGTGVVNVPGGSLFSPDGRWALFLEGYNPAAQAGQLKVADLSQPGAAPASLGARVSYMLVSPDSRAVAFVDGGTLKVGPLPQGPFREVGGEVATAEFSPDASLLVFKRRLSAAGGLAVVPADGSRPPQKLGDQVGDYKVSPDGKHVAFAARSPATPDVYDLFVASAPAFKTSPVGKGTTTFAFSPDSRFLARTEGFRPGVMPDLFLGAAAGGPGRKLGERVEEFTFSPDTYAVAFLERFDEAAKAGVVSVARLPDGAPKRLAGRVPNYAWGKDGKTLAFLQRFLQPLYSVDLMVWREGDEKPAKVGTGVFGYGFTPDDGGLLYRTTCTREGRACDLMRVDPARPEAPPKKLASGIFSFKVSEDGGRLLTTVARLDAPTFDVVVQNLASGQSKTLGQRAVLPAYFVGRDGGRVLYLLQSRGQKGVFLSSDVP